MVDAGATKKASDPYENRNFQPSLKIILFLNKAKDLPFLLIKTKRV
jgi:hypothetical protein